MKNKIFEHVVRRLHYILIITLAIFLCVTDFNTTARIFLIVSGAYILMYELYLYFSTHSAKKLSNDIISMLDLTSQRRLTEYPIPILISNKNGTVLWYNDSFLSVADENEIIKLKNVNKIDSRLLTRRQSKIYFSGKYFTVYMDCSIINNREMYVLYFIDMTQLQQLQQKYNRQKTVIAHILIDNYDELFQNSKDSERSVATLSIDNMIDQWAQSVNGVLRKIDKESYLFIFKNEDLSIFTDERFSILDQVRTLEIAAGIAPTISIGIGLSSKSLSDCDEQARLALDMALSRGGDQAVIKTPDGFEFFGGTSKGIEKRSKVKSRVVAGAFGELLKQTDTLLVMGHQMSDFDSLGACVGMARIGLETGKKVGIVYDITNSMANQLYETLIPDKQISSLFVSAEQALIMAGPKTLVCVVDTHRKDYTTMPKLLDYASKIMVVDHHRKAADFIENADIFFHEPYASSTCEMVAELIQYMNINRIPAVEAEAMLSGIYLDTKSFSIRTNRQTFEASSFLRKMGANTVQIKKLFQTDMQTYMQRTKLVESAVLYKKTAAIAVWKGDQGPQFKIAASQAADEMLNIEGVQAAFTLFADKQGTVNISGRSFGAVNVQLIMEKLGGGGHQTMAGVQLKNISLDEAVKKLQKAIDEYFLQTNFHTER